MIHPDYLVCHFVLSVEYTVKTKSSPKMRHHNSVPWLWCIKANYLNWREPLLLLLPSPRRLCFSVCFFVYQQDYAKATRPIFMKLGGGVEHGPRKNPFKMQYVGFMVIYQRKQNIVYSILRIMFSFTQNEPFVSTQGAGPLPQRPPCFYSSPERTNQKKLRGPFTFCYGT